jgi:hypothetical protein
MSITVAKGEVAKAYSDRRKVQFVLNDLILLFWKGSSQLNSYKSKLS